MLKFDIFKTPSLYHTSINWITFVRPTVVLRRKLSNRIFYYVVNLLIWFTSETVNCYKEIVFEVKGTAHNLSSKQTGYYDITHRHKGNWEKHVHNNEE